MEATFTNTIINHNLSSQKIMQTFFALHNPETVKEHFFKLFQCWVIKDCKLKAEIADEEIALFFDQLTDLVTVTHQFYLASQPKGEAHE